MLSEDMLELIVNANNHERHSLTISKRIRPIDSIFGMCEYSFHKVERDPLRTDFTTMSS